MPDCTFVRIIEDDHDLFGVELFIVRVGMHHAFAVDQQGKNVILKVDIEVQPLKKI